MKHKIISFSILTGNLAEITFRSYRIAEFQYTLFIFDRENQYRLMAMKAIIINLALIISLSCAAQNISIPQDYEAKENLRELGSMDGTGNVRTFDTRYEGVKGTPYVFEEFHPGEVYLKTKNKVAVQDLNYNCFENEIVYMDPATKVIRIMNRFQVDLFTIRDGDRVLTFVPVKLEDDAETIFAEVLYNIGSIVYKVYEKEWLNANYEGGYSADRRYDQFVDKYDLYFMKKGEKVLYKARNSKKQVIAAFPDHEKEISSYIKSNKLNLKEDSSLLNLLVYYDSL